MILVTMTGTKHQYEEFWFEDETEDELYFRLTNLNYELDPA